MGTLDNTTIEIRTIDESQHHILPHGQQIVQIELQQDELIEQTQLIEVQESGGGIIIHRQPIQIHQPTHLHHEHLGQQLQQLSPSQQQHLQQQIINQQNSPIHVQLHLESQQEEQHHEENELHHEVKVQHLQQPQTPEPQPPQPQPYKRENIIDLSEIKFSPKEDLNAFYQKFRASVCDHLLKSGFGLEEEEVLPPMCEELIVVWCLEKIDPSVPKQVKETFGPQLQGDVTLKDLQEEIFKVIPVFLNLNDKEGFEDDSFFEAKANPVDVMKQEYEDDSHMDMDEDDVDQPKPRVRASKRVKFNPPADGNMENVCKICGKKFKSEKHLGWHQRYHRVDEIPSKCTICGKQFESKYKLNYHKQVHKIEKCECYVCNKTFQTRKNMKDHIYKHHRYDIQCHKCEDVLPDYAEYGEHLQKIHQEDVQLFIRNEPGVHGKSSRLPPRSEEDPDDTLTTDEESSDDEENDVVGDDSGKEEEGGEDSKTQDSKEVYSCEVENCTATFKSEKRLHRHQKTHTGKKGPFACPTCGKEFNNKPAFDSHKRTHKIEISACDICGKTYNKRKSLRDHIYKHHRMNIECKKCNITLSNNDDYNQHMKDHSNSEPKKEFSCEVCGKILKSLPSLRLHVANHERNMTCTMCHVKFEYKNLYNKHMATVHNVVNAEEKKTPCELCGKLVTQQRLKGHMKTHLSKFKCGTCSRAFTSEKELGSHICKHYTCDICDRKFVYIRNLEFHKREHAGEVMFQCDMCEALFLKKNRLAEHKRFLHFKVRRYKCEICLKDFAVKNGLDNHMRSHTGERPFKCEDCGQTFALNSSLYTHKKLHTNELPHECDGCLKRFRNSGNLKTHRERKLCGVTDIDLFRNNVEN